MWFNKVVSYNDDLDSQQTLGVILFKLHFDGNWMQIQASIMVSKPNNKGSIFIRGILRSKMGLLRKCTTKINFIRSNRIQDDDVNHGG